MRSLFHKHNSLPLGQIQALVSFYCWVQWLNWTKLTDKSDIRWTNEVWLQSYLKHRSLVLKTNCAYTIQAKKKFYCIDPWSQLLSGRCSRYILHLGRHQFVPLTLSSYLWMKVWILKAEYTNLRRGSIIVLLTSWFFVWIQMLCFLKWAIPALFFFIFVFSIHSWQFTNVQYVNFFCQWLDSNQGPLVSEATALPTEPQPLPIQICWIGISFTCLVESKPVKQEVRRTVILPLDGECSLLKVSSYPALDHLKTGLKILFQKKNVTGSEWRRLEYFVT